MKQTSGAVGVLREQQGVDPAIHVGNIYATVGTNETVLCLRDEHTSAPADNPLTLRKRQLNHTGVEPVTAGPDTRGR